MCNSTGDNISLPTQEVNLSSEELTGLIDKKGRHISRHETVRFSIIVTIDQSRLNYEDETEHEIQIEFFNQSTRFNRTFLIHIEDVNEPPLNLQYSHSTGFCTAFDEDFNQTLTFQIHSLNASHMELQCTDNGHPSLSVAIGINLLPDQQSVICLPIYSLVMTRDRNIVGLDSTNGDNTEEEQQRRQRRQANSPPQEIYFNMFYLNIPENSRDFEVAHVYVIDEDNDNYTCSIFAFDLADDEQPFEIHDEVLRTSLTMHNNNYDLDFETVPVYNVTVTCVDPIHHFTITKNFSIYIEDVNEAPVELILTPNILPENSPVGFVIGQFHSIDPDQYPVNQTFEYSIANDPNHLFILENDRLILNRANQVEKCISDPDLCPHDYEQKSSLYIRMQVEDNGEPRALQKFWIQIPITDENDPPGNFQLESNLVEENSPIGQLVGSFLVQDQDFYQTHTFVLLQETPLSSEGNAFFIDDNQLHLARVLNYEQDEFILITVQTIDNGTIPKNITRDFLIEILDIDELPDTYVFLPNVNPTVSDDVMNDLIERKQPVRTHFLPQSAYMQNPLGRIVFLIEDRDRIVDLIGFQSIEKNEFNFSQPSCQFISDSPYRLLCTSIVTINNSSIIHQDHDENGHLVITSLTLTSNNQSIIFPRSLRIKFENITLTIDGNRVESIEIPTDSPMGYQIGRLGAIDLAATGQSVENVILNPNNSLSYPFEIVNGTVFKIRDDVNQSSLNLPSIFNVSVLVTTTGEDSRVIEKVLTVYLKDKRKFNLTLSNNLVFENANANLFVGDLMFEDGFGNYTIDLIDDANGRFKLNGYNLLTARKPPSHCHALNSCPFDYETEPQVNITIAIRDPITNQTLGLTDFSLEIGDENETPYNLTLSTQSISENTTVDSVVGLFNAFDDDFNQTLIYSTDDPHFRIEDNQLILRRRLDSHRQPIIPIIVRVDDDGEPSTSTEKTFLISVAPVNQPPANVTSHSMIVYYPSNSNSSSIITGQLRVIDPDVKENFTITFNHPNYRALTPASNSYSVISDDGNVLYAQMYHINIEDLNPPLQANHLDYSVNITANITDSAGHSFLHDFAVRYIPRPIMNITISSTMSPPTTPMSSFSHALHIHIYETTPPNTPIMRGLIRSSLNNSIPTCVANDDQMFPFLINASRTAFVVSLPENYTLNLTTNPRIFLNVQCHIANDTNVDQDIVIDVLPPPPVIQINFNQTRPFHAITNNHTIHGTFSLIESTDIPTNRTYDLSLLNYQQTFQLLPNDSLIQIGPYPLNLLQNDNPHIDLNIQAVETTPNQPTRFIQKTFSLPIIRNTSAPYLSFSQFSLPSDTHPNTTIGNLTAHNITALSQYRLHLLENYNNGLEFDRNTSQVILRRPLHTFPLMNNQTQLLIRAALMNESNHTVLNATFPLMIIYPNASDLCQNQDCGNGTCIQSNQSFAYCLCTTGYQGINCRRIDSCAYNPCANNGICEQLSTTGDFICRCLPNYSGTLCQIFVDLCQLNRSLCSAREICIPKETAELFECIARDDFQYFVFDYLNRRRNIDVVNDENFPEQIRDFLQRNSFPNGDFLMSERRMLGPIKYNRAELFAIAFPSSNSTSNETFQSFCFNQPSIVDSFAREICNGYARAIDLDRYFQSTPTFCPNCSFPQAADKYYWFDKVIPFLPLWIALIVGSLLMAAIPWIPLSSNAPKKVAVPLMKTRTGPEDNLDEYLPVLTKSVRSAVKKNSRKSSRERHDSGYESTEEKENYFEQIISHHQNEQQIIDVYPVLHTSRSPNLDRRGTTIDDLISSRKPPDRRHHTQRSASMSRRSSTRTSQTLKPIIQRRPTLFESNSSSMMRLGNPSHSDHTYVSSRFRNENTSKFVIGTLWNTFALVNNLFLHRPHTRRNAMTGENIQAEQLAHLQRLYSLAERDQENSSPTNSNFHSAIREALLEPQTNHLQSIVLDMISSSNRERKRCTCYGNHHLPSCIYYDHSLPYIKRYLENTSELERIFYDIRKSNQPKVQDATTQSHLDKPIRTFLHTRSTVNTATQSSPIAVYSHVCTQYSPMGNQILHSIRPISMNMSTQTTNDLNSTPVEYTNIFPQRKSKDHLYINIPSAENDKIPTAQYTTDNSTQYSAKPLADDRISDRRNSLLNELKEKICSSNRKTPITTAEEEEEEEDDEEENLLPNHTVRSLVSMFEITSPIDKKSPNNNTKVLTPPEISTLNITTEEIPNSIDQYANEVASNIVDNAVLTATTTAIHQHEQLQRRFSLYKNGGGYGKNLLFQSNTFVPSNENVYPQNDVNLRAESQTSSALLNDRLPNELEPSQHTLIVGRYVNGHELRRKSRSLNNLNEEYSSTSDDDQPIDHRQFLSNSQLVSAHEIYIRPWLIRRATAPDIHCLDHHISDTRIESINLSPTYFSIFPKNNNPKDLYTRLTCLVTILFYLRDIHDENSNRILFDEIDRIERRLTSPQTTPSPAIQSNSFQTINPDGSKRYRTGIILDINGSPMMNYRRKILAQQIEWKCVKVLVRRFRKKYRYYKQLMKTDEKHLANYSTIDRYLNQFDSTCKRRIRKYAKHYADKL